MGQQQLLLVLLVVIVVGIATIVATNVISQGAVEANRDAVRQDLLTASASVQEVWERPTIMGGAGRDFTEEFDDVLLTSKINLPGSQSGNEIINENGTYEISTINGFTAEIQATPETPGEPITITVERDSEFGWIYTITDGDLIVTNRPED